MRIAFVWYWERASEILPNYRDGLRTAIELIGKDHEVVWFLDKEVPNPNEKWDFILFWSDSNCEFFNELHKYDCKKGICLTTNPHNFENLSKLDAIYCESDVVYDEVRRHGLHAVRAFGTDTDFFKPDPDAEKIYKYFYPATFSPWKKQSDIAYLGKDLLCVGTVQPDGQDELIACKENGVIVEEGYFPVSDILKYYQESENVIIPAVHGSERTVLEAMSCGIVPDVTNADNMKAMSFIQEYKKSIYQGPREFVINNYSHYLYAQKLLEGME